MILLGVWSVAAAAGPVFTGEARAVDTAKPRGDPGQAAVVTALEWLRWVDSGKYGKSWDTAAGFLQATIPRAQWIEAMADSRMPLGSVVIRRLVDKTVKTGTPASQTARYVILRFRTSFTYKEDAEETVIPMEDADGVWRVSGYFIR
jgi:hypothetical protein